MKILIIGGGGTIGKTVVAKFKQDHEVIIAGRSSKQAQVDIESSESIEQLFKKVGKVDAIVCIAGEARWKPFRDMSEEDLYVGIKSKLMGQVNLSRIGMKHLNNYGSITLSTGILADDPVIQTTSAAMVNGAIHSFVKALALETDHGIRINAVSSGLVQDAVAKYDDYFPGHTPIPMWKVVNGYVRSVEGRGNGEVIRIYDN